MLTDSQLQLFVRTLGSHKHIKRGAITRFEGAPGDVPGDVIRVLDQVGGWRYQKDLRFTETAKLETERAAWSKLVDDFEAGTSETSSHALWNRSWYPLATSSAEVHAFDPIGCFGGAPQQVVSFDKAGDTWTVFPTMALWLNALIDGFETEGKDAFGAAKAWARANKASVEVKLPATIEEQRSPQRFEAGIGAWLVLRHPDGRSWAIRERRDGYELRIGEGEDAVVRKRSAPQPSAEVRRLTREQKGEGFLP